MTDLFLVGISNHLNYFEFMKAEPLIRMYNPDALFIESGSKALRVLGDFITQGELYNSLSDVVKEIIPVGPDTVYELDNYGVALLEAIYLDSMLSFIKSSNYEKYAFPIGGLHLSNNESPIELVLKNQGFNVSSINLLSAFPVNHELMINERKLLLGKFFKIA